MTTLQELFLIFVCVYVSECWMKGVPHSIIWFSFWGKRFRKRFPFFVLGPDKAGFAFTGLWPFSKSYVSTHWLFSVSEQGVANRVEPLFNVALSSTGLPQTIAFSDIHQIEIVDAKLVINGSLFARALTPLQARFWKDWLLKLKAASLNDRQKLISKRFKTSLSLELLRNRFQHIPRLHHALLKGLCSGLWGLLFLGIPLSWSHAPQWLNLLLGMGVWAWLMILIVFFQLKQKLQQNFPNVEFSSLQKNIFLFLSPLAAIRAYSRLFQYFLVDFHPLALAAFFLKEDEQVEFLKKGFLALEYPLGKPQVESSSLSSSIQFDFHQQWKSEVKQWAAQEKIDFDALIAPPMPDSPQSLVYCPRCQTQYTQAFAQCQDCNMIKLRSFFRVDELLK